MYVAQAMAKSKKKVIQTCYVLTTIFFKARKTNFSMEISSSIRSLFFLLRPNTICWNFVSDRKPKNKKYAFCIVYLVWGGGGRKAFVKIRISLYKVIFYVDLVPVILVVHYSCDTRNKIVNFGKNTTSNQHL